ncbi:MAG: hypothetical protein KBF32_04265 [Chitinophagales bacterium]|nr:hypothetical protein [Chitinophagales bacterium]
MKQRINTRYIIFSLLHFVQIRNKSSKRLLAYLNNIQALPSPMILGAIGTD